MKNENAKIKSISGCFFRGIAVLLVALLGAYIIIEVIANSIPNCNENSESVAYARSLSKERLEKLYYDMERLSLDDSIPYYGYVRRDREDEQKFPEPFSDIAGVKVRPREANIMLQGCFDHYVYLSFEGFEKNKTFEPNRQIVLSWGEHEPYAGSEVIWKEELKDKRDAATIIFAFQGPSRCYFSDENVVARSEQELVSYLLVNDYQEVNIESRIKLLEHQEDRLIHCMKDAKIVLKSFLVPTSDEPGQIDLMQPE